MMSHTPALTGREIIKPIQNQDGNINLWIMIIHYTLQGRKLFSDNMA